MTVILASLCYDKLLEYSHKYFFIVLENAKKTYFLIFIAYFLTFRENSFSLNNDTILNEMIPNHTT